MLFHEHAFVDVHAQALPAVHAQAPPDKAVVPTHVASLPSWAATTASHVASAPALPVHVPTTVPTHVASLPSWAATTASHVASAPALPVHVPSDSDVQAALLVGSALPEQAMLALLFHVHALDDVHAQAPPDVPSTVPTHVASFPFWEATTASHVASAPALPVQVPRDSEVQAALLAGSTLFEQAGFALLIHEHALADVHAQGLPAVNVHALDDVHAQAPPDVPSTVPTHVASFPSWAATTALHVASAPALPAHVPRDSEVQAALFAGLALLEHAVLAAAEVHVLAEDVPTQVASFPSWAATTASHVASAPVLPVHVPRDSEAQAALFAGLALSEQAVLAAAVAHVLAALDVHVLARAEVHVLLTYIFEHVELVLSATVAQTAKPVHVPLDSVVGFARPLVLTMVVTVPGNTARGGSSSRNEGASS